MGRASTRRLGILIALVAGATAILAGTAQANTVTVGSSLTAPGFAPVPFAAQATVTNYVLPTPATAVSPVTGTVVSWRFIGSGGPLTPRVLRSTGGTSLTGAGTGAARNATAPGVVSGPFSVSIPIRAGDFFGVDGASPSSLSVAPTPGATSLYFEPALADGGAGQAPTGTNPEEDAISATVRYCLVPKMKGKTGKAARQALNTNDCEIGTVTRAKRRFPVKRVLAQGVKAGKKISDTDPVDLRISRKTKS
jgi:hypothetical protein